MPSPTDSSILDALNAVQQDVLQALVAGQSISAAAKSAGVHRSTVHNWTRHHPRFAPVLLEARHTRAERLLDELGDLTGLAIDTFRHILSDQDAPASTRLKAAMEIVKIVQNQRPTELAQLKKQLHDDGVFADLAQAQVANLADPSPITTAAPITAAPSATVPSAKLPVRNAPCPCGSSLKYKRCCGSPAQPARAA